MYEKLHHTSNNILFLDSPVNRSEDNKNGVEIFIKHFDSLSKNNVSKYSQPKNAKEEDSTKLAPSPSPEYWIYRNCHGNHSYAAKMLSRFEDVSDSDVVALKEGRNC